MVSFILLCLEAMKVNDEEEEEEEEEAFGVLAVVLARNDSHTFCDS